MEFLSRSLCGSRVVCKFHEPSRHSLISLHVFVEKFTWIEVGCSLMAGLGEEEEAGDRVSSESVSSG